MEQLRALLHRGRISNDGLRELLTALQQQNIDLEDAAKQGVHRDAFLDRTRRMGVKVQMPLADGSGHFDWFFLNPNTLLASMVMESKSLQKHFASALQRHPSTADQPWRIAVGCPLDDPATD